MRCLLDSGCLVGNIVDASWLLDKKFRHNRKNMHETLMPLSKTPRTVESTAVSSAIGEIELEVTLDSGERKLMLTAMFIVMKSAFPLVMGWPTLRLKENFSFYIGVLGDCAEDAEDGPTIAQLGDYSGYKPIYENLRSHTPSSITALFRERGVMGADICKVVAEHQHLGVETARDVRKGETICKYTSAAAEMELGKKADVHYALRTPDGRIFSRPSETDYQLGPLVNDALSERGNNVRATVDWAGNCYLRATRFIKAGEPLGLAYGADAWGTILNHLRGCTSAREFTNLRRRAEHYYGEKLIATVDLIPVIGETYLNPLDAGDDAPEESDIREANGVPEDVLSTPLTAEELAAKIKDYRDELPRRVTPQVEADCPGIMDFMSDAEVINVFAPRDWTGVRHPDTGETWVFVIEWISAPGASRAKLIRVRPEQLEPAVKEINRLKGIKFWVLHFGHIASSMLVAPKKTDPFIRLVADYAWLGPYLALPKWPLKHVKDSLNFVKDGGFQYFFDCDLMNSFHQCRIDDQSSEYLSLLTPVGQLRPRFLPEGISPATAILQMMVDTIFRDCTHFVLAIYDNLLICGKTKLEAYENFKRVVGLCVKHNVKLKLKKCSFCVDTVSFFGYVVNKGQYHLEEERVVKAQEIPFPGDDSAAKPKAKLKQMQSYLGMTNFFAPFMVGYAHLTHRLQDLIKEDFNWDPATWAHDYRAIFDRHKKALLDTIPTFFPDYNLEWVLETDASQHAMGGILYQNTTDGQKQPLALLSHKFGVTAQKWHIIDKECYAIYHCCKKLRNLLRGKHFTVCTDAMNLTWMATSGNPRVQRFLAELLSLSWNLRHIPGKLNVIADWISRMHPEASEESVQAVAASLIDDLELTGSAACSVLSTLHSSGAGHHGVARTWKKLKQLYPDSTLTMQDVKNFVEDCPVCQMTSPGNKPTLQPIAKVLRSEHARNKVAFDLASIQESRQGNKYILVVYNLFTKFVKLYAVKDKTARTTAHCLMQYFADFGLYDICHSDAGSDYTSSELRELLEGYLGMGRSFALVDNPQADGVEPAVKQMLRHLTALCLDKSTHETWDDEVTLSLVQLVMNEAISTRTGISPLEAQFGHFDSVRFKLPDIIKNSCDSQWVRAVAKQLADIREASREFQEGLHLKRENKEGFVQRRYMPTDYVTVMRDKWSKASKLSAHGEGPYEVISHPVGSNHVKVKSLVTGAELTFDLKDLRAFVGSQREAQRLARSDKRETVVVRIEGHTGDPRTRTGMDFALRYEDGELIWHKWSKAIADTEAFKTYCSRDRWLRLLTVPVKEAEAEIKTHTNKVIPQHLVNTEFLIDLRSFGANWYRNLAPLPDHLTTTYLVKGRYDQYADQQRTKIWYTIPCLAEHKEATSHFVYYHGYRTEPQEGEVVLTDQQVDEYGIR